MLPGTMASVLASKQPVHQLDPCSSGGGGTTLQDFGLTEYRVGTDLRRVSLLIKQDRFAETTGPARDVHRRGIVKLFTLEYSVQQSR